MSNLGKKATDDDDVEQLLRQAHDDVLLKLSVNSHTARGSAAAAIDPDLDRRFQALKKPQKLTNNRDDSLNKTATDRSKAASAVAEDDDLYSRFAALKTSLPSNSSNFTRNDVVEEQEDDEDEVEKLIRWATDAARLDPSPPSEDDDEDDSDEDEGASRGKKGKRK
ncbi:hypothetical protein SASPL_140593 [Salvia splendens]|uniref:Uncharacterized protein n=1 Tax=Salvia splendens TaxID=180675 RepID=A0A8X8ZCM2_SALSN|nr:uncharacterized protein LOC121767263 [Salvia splendens]KAG6399119.1 hypothetical protein SASPL_140593 [Salvia splendens]